MSRKLNAKLGDKKKKELKVLFVSKHGACRGPMAECIFNHLAEKYNLKSFARFIWKAHSAGMEAYNQGNLPEAYTLRVLSENNLHTLHGCRKLIAMKVLFVSKHDICRGPMAESIFNHLADKYNSASFSKAYCRANSAGLKPFNQGDRPEQLALRVLAENNLDTMHISRRLRQFDFTRYDYILCMEPTQLAALVEMAPMDKKARIYMLGDFMKGREKVILDPFDADLNTFRICFERLYIACEDFYFQVNEKRIC